MTTRLPSGSEFLKRMISLNSMLALPALGILLACLSTLLRLTAEQWLWFAATAGLYGVAVTPLTAWIQRGMAAPVRRWLDARARGESGEAELTAAFRCSMLLPARAGFQAAFGWVVPVVLVTSVMWLRFEGWGLLQTLVMSVSGVAAGFTVGIAQGFLFKLRFADVRDALVRELDDPVLRAGLIRTIPIRTKLLSTVTGATLVPVIFAVMLSHTRTEASLEEFAVRWQSELLAAAADPAEPIPLETLRERLEAAPLPVPVVLGSLGELEESLGAEVVRRVRAEVAEGVERGDSSHLPSSHVYTWRLLADGRVLVAASPAEALSGNDSRSLLVFAALLLCSVGLAVSVSYLIAGDISAATEVLRSEAERMASGDLTRGRVFESEDELGALARSFESMAGRLRQTIGRVAEAADRVEATAGRLSPVSESLTGVTRDQVTGIEQAASSMEEINAQVRGIAGSSQALNESVEESSSSILELGASGEELNETATLLGSKVEEVSSSIEQMVRSVKQVSENTETLSEAAVETSASMDEMASSLRSVDTSAGEAARLSTEVVASAEQGQEKVRQTIEGMEAIRQATDTAERVIRNLHGRTEEIGAIVDVIDDVADETNLLALNAAIIAAQAGEHGRAFSVVADEIKDLAERVLTSTKEIGTLIGSVQDEATNAISAIELGSSSVASGVDLSAEAGMALEEITRASRESGTRISGIVGALREQAKAAGHVVDLMERVRTGVDEITAASAEQDRGNVVVYQGSVTMREVAQQVRGTTEEQARGSGRIRESVEGVREAVEQINAALQEQSQACAAAVEFLEAVRSRTRANEESTQSLETISVDLLRQAEGLRDEVQRFRV